MDTTFTSSDSMSRVRRIELTRAVLPVPGEPEIYKLVGIGMSMLMDVGSRKEARKEWIAARSGSRPAIWVVELLHVARRSARARAWMGRREVGGVGGGVEIVRREIAATGVAGTRFEVDACLLGADYGH